MLEKWHEVKCQAQGHIDYMVTENPQDCARGHSMKTQEEGGPVPAGWAAEAEARSTGRGNKQFLKSSLSARTPVPRSS